MIYKLYKLIKNPRFALSLLLANRIFAWIPDETYLRILYRIRIGKKLNLNNPKSFNEKLQWLKLYDRREIYTTLVDKYKVRQYISNTVGQQYLVPLLGIYDKFNEIDFKILPDKFVLKCTHDSGGVVVCTNKSKFDLGKAKSKIERRLNINFYFRSREWPYKNVDAKIICEKFLEDNISNELVDYKFMCFNGKVMCSFVCINRQSMSGLNVDFYDTEWKFMPFQRHYKNSNTVTNKPINYDKMIEISEVLSKEFPFMRVDFYEANHQLYIGELTLYPGAGFEEFTPESFDYLLGSWLKLPNLT